MTYETFLEKLRGTPRNWYLKCGKFIRTTDTPVTGFTTHCPLNAVLGAVEAQVDRFEPWQVEVMAAADASFHAIEAIRRDLLTACGLQEAV